MSHELLKKLRIIIPGLMICFVILTVIGGKIEIEKIFSQIVAVDTVYFTLVVFFLGGAYHLLNIRGPFIKKSLEKIHNNIKTEMLKPFKDDLEISSKSDGLAKGRTLINILYNFADEDSSLQIKTKNIYFNGIFWTTTIDLIPVSFLGIILNFVFYTAYKSKYYLIAFIMWIIIYAAAYILLLPRVTQKHIDLSNEQIEFMKTKYFDKLKKQIKEAPLG